MRVSGIIHQQICQLKWHLLACLGLIMVLPIEEAIVNLKEGGGFFSSGMSSLAVMFGPLLAGLIACANVQGDLNEKRYIFWRSKPANIKFLITLKFFIGLIISLMILACPVVFTFVCKIIWNGEGIDSFVSLPILIAIMTYSLCFASNVVVRKTARAWLIGMLLAGFLLVLPFMLPLGYKDFVSDVMMWTLTSYLVIMLIASVSAFVFALYAAQHDWHLRTSLRGLLWAVAGLVFALMVLFSSQVANIKVLQEKKIESSLGLCTLKYAGSRIVFQGHSYIDAGKDGISFSKIESGDVGADPNSNIDTDSSVHRTHYSLRAAGYSRERYPRNDNLLYTDIGNEIFIFSIDMYFRTVAKGPSVKRYFEKVYLRSYKHTGKNWMPVCELDISDCLTNNKRWPRVAMRLIDNLLIAFLNDSCIMVDATNPRELIDKKLDVLKKYRLFPYKGRQKEFAIPLVPIEEIRLEERIKLSIDLNYRFYYSRNRIYESSIVDIHDGKFAFAFVGHDDVARFDVTRWDDEKVYCRFSGARPFTILEGITTSPHYTYYTFAKKGKLYSYQRDNLMVFDIRSNRRIRKLGHFVRMNYDIDDIAVLENGNILLSIRLDTNLGKNRSKKRKTYLYLLKNPE
jgi:hypothetical protein